MDLRNQGAALALAGILTIGLAACGGSDDAEMSADTESPKPVAEAAYAEEANNEVHASEAMQMDASSETLVVYKTESCGCCEKWVDHMKQAGFETEVHNVSQEEMSAMKTANGIGRDLASCHTAQIAGYLVEGHVPAEDLQRLLKEKPADVKGIAVPGMPIGSPGMEVPSGEAEPFETIVFDRSGKTKVFANHPGVPAK